MIVKMNQDNMGDINKPNQPFRVFGRIIPCLRDGAWSFTEELFSGPFTKRYPDEDLNYRQFAVHPDKTVYFWYEGNACVGQIILGKYWNRYAYVYDLSVAADHRKRASERRSWMPRRLGQGSGNWEASCWKPRTIIWRPADFTTTMALPSEERTPCCTGIWITTPNPQYSGICPCERSE